MRLFVQQLWETTDCSSIQNAPRAVVMEDGKRCSLLGEDGLIGPLCGGVSSELKPLRAALQDGCVGQYWSPKAGCLEDASLSQLNAAHIGCGGAFQGQMAPPIKPKMMTTDSKQEIRVAGRYLLLLMFGHFPCSSIMSLLSTKSSG